MREEKSFSLAFTLRKGAYKSREGTFVREKISFSLTNVKKRERISEEKARS